jgi:hypothetical protein
MHNHSKSNLEISQRLHSEVAVSGDYLPGRRGFLLGGGMALIAMAGALPSPARAAGLTDLLGQASDSALDKLAQPGAFYGDEAVRIKLPLVGDLGGSLLGGSGLGSSGALGDLAGGLLGGSGGNIAGLLSGITRKINDAAGTAAGEAKPIFRESIGALSLSDAPGIIKQDDGATQYLRESAGDSLLGKLRPLIDTSMTEIGVYREIDQLSEKSEWVGRAGLTNDKVGSSVTDQALDGIFSYIGQEEAKFRANPLDKVGGILKGILR